jgi:hypothetical protein
MLMFSLWGRTYWFLPLMRTKADELLPVVSMTYQLVLYGPVRIKMSPSAHTFPSILITKAWLKVYNEILNY